MRVSDLQPANVLAVLLVQQTLIELRLDQGRVVIDRSVVGAVTEDIRCRG